MASAKQIAWRKKFARMSKAGKFKKSKKALPKTSYGRLASSRRKRLEKKFARKMNEMKY